MSEVFLRLRSATFQRKNHPTHDERIYLQITQIAQIQNRKLQVVQTHSRREVSTAGATDRN